MSARVEPVEPGPIAPIELDHGVSRLLPRLAQVLGTWPAPRPGRADAPDEGHARIWLVRRIERQRDLARPQPVFALTGSTVHAGPAPHCCCCCCCRSCSFSSCRRSNSFCWRSWARIVLRLLALRLLVGDVAAGTTHRCTRQRADRRAGADIAGQSADQRAAGRTYARADTGTARRALLRFGHRATPDRDRPRTARSCRASRQPMFETGIPACSASSAQPDHHAHGHWSVTARNTVSIGRSCRCSGCARA